MQKLIDEFELNNIKTLKLYQFSKDNFFICVIDDFRDITWCHNSTNLADAKSIFEDVIAEHGFVLDSIDPDRAYVSYRDIKLENDDGNDAA